MDSTREIAPYPEDIVQEIMRWQDFDNATQLIGKITFFKFQNVLFEDKTETAVIRQTERMHFWRHDRSPSSRIRFLEMQPGLINSLRSPYSDLMHKLYHAWLSFEHHHNTTLSIPLLQEKLQAENLSAEFLTLLSFVSPKSLADLIETLLLQDAQEVWSLLADIPPKYFRKHRNDMGARIISELIAILTVNPSAAPQGDCLADLLEQYWPYVTDSSFTTLETLQKFLAELSKKAECIYNENNKLRDVLRMIFKDIQHKLSKTNRISIFTDFPFNLPEVSEESPGQMMLHELPAPEATYNDHVLCALNWWEYYMQVSQQELLNTEWLGEKNTLKRHLPYLNEMAQAAIFLKLFLCWQAANEETDKAMLYPMIGQYCERFDETLQERLYQTLQTMLEEQAHFVEQAYSPQIARANEVRDILYLCCDILDKTCCITDKISTLLCQYFPFLAKHYPKLAQHVLQSLEGKIPRAHYQNHVLELLPNLFFISRHETFHGLRFLKHLALQDYPLLQEAIEKHLCTLPPEKNTLTTLLEIACVKGLSDHSIQFLADHIPSEDPYLRLAFKVVVACKQTIQAPLPLHKDDMLVCPNLLEPM